MTFKAILFCLFLYVSLVWVGAVYLYSGPRIQQIGLLWTASGLTAVLAFLLLSKLWGWARLWRTKAALKPKPLAKPAPPVHEDDAAMRALLKEADAAFKQGGQASLSSLPLYLLIGPEGSGKTSTFLHSGLEPQLLAGETAGAHSVLPTRLCNFWLAKGTLFIEISGRAFSGDPERWRQLLKAMEAKPPAPRWYQIWKEPEAGIALRGVVAFHEVKNFMMASSPQGRERLDAQCREWQERLGVIAEVFGGDYPVYLVATKGDTLPYFSDFFRRLPESETGQVLGCTLPLSGLANDGGTRGQTVEEKGKRLTKTFSALYYALAERRISHLAHEPDPAQRPGIYEFPRELKRIRPAVIQFLSSVFRSHSLRPTPQLRGYYLSATGERPAVPLTTAESGTHWTEGGSSLEATVLFRGDATQIFRPNEGETASKSAPYGGFTKRWLFVSELFGSIILADRPGQRTAPVDPRVEQYRRTVCIAVCAACLLLCGIFLRSWTGNLNLLHSVNNTEWRKGASPTLAELQSLDRLRVQASQLLAYQHGGAPWSLRWGLYAGNRIALPAKNLYFRRFEDLLLNAINGIMVARLRALPDAPAPDAPYNPAFRFLKTHLMVSSGAVCSPEPAFVAGVLKDTVAEIAPSGEGTAGWKSLADQQIEFYADELRYGNPCKLAENTAARDCARQYLTRIQGTDRIYSGILAAAEKKLTKSQRLGDLSPSYTEVLSGGGEVSGAFTQEGWSYVETASKKGNSGSAGDSCVLGGSAGSGDEGKGNAEVERAIKRMFIRDYVERWRRFVTAFSVKGYGSPGDAARKLEVLSDHKSPLLALLAMTSNQTNFSPSATEPEGLERVKPMVKKFFPSLGSAAKPLGSPPDVSANLTSSPAQITRLFQPVHWVVPAGSETWVIDKNSAYIDALAQLGHSMGEIARSGATPDPAVFQTASQNYDKALDAARQIARGFDPVGVAGLDEAVKHLLEAPVRGTQKFIITDMDSAIAGKVNGQLHVLCAHLGSTLRKYPFRPSSEDAGIEEISSLFAPGSGAIWKFQAQFLAELTVKEGAHWNPKDPAKKPQVTPEMLAFLNRAQAISDAFYPAGASQPQFTYTLRPKIDPSYRDAILELDVDGQTHMWTSSLQKQFTWPSPAGKGNTGVVGRIKSGSLSFPFASRGGAWGIFRVMGDAEPRPLGSKLIEWKHVRGGDGRLEEIQPAPVRLEIVEFPGGADLFNPKFFEGLQCPAKTVQ